MPPKKPPPKYHVRRRRYPGIAIAEHIGAMTSRRGELRRITPYSVAYLARADPFPARLLCDLAYSDRYTLTQDGTVGNTTATIQTFRLNSLFDPDLTGTGHQPYGFDQLTPIYNNYCVTGCTIEADMTAASTAGGMGFFTVQPSSNFSSISGKTLSQLLERFNVWASEVPQAGAADVWRIRRSFSIHAVEGLPNAALLYVGGYAAQVASNPTNSPTIQFAFCAPTVGTQITLTVKLIYHCVFWNRNSIIQS